LSLELQKREKRVNELEQIIANKDAIVRALKEKVANALLGFRDKGLSVVEKDGKVYVSMDAKLLFASGSTKVDAEGIKALKELAKVLEDQQDLEILVEGHTCMNISRVTRYFKNYMGIFNAAYYIFNPALVD